MLLFLLTAIFIFVCLVILSLTTECNLMNFFRHNWYLYCTKNYGNQTTTTTKWRCHIWRCHIQKLAHNAKTNDHHYKSWSVGPFAEEVDEFLVERGSIKTRNDEKHSFIFHAIDSSECFMAMSPEFCCAHKLHLSLMA